METHQHVWFKHDVWTAQCPLSNLYLQMSKAFRASPDTADTFLAQNWTAEGSMIPSAEAWCDEHHQTSQHESKRVIRKMLKTSGSLPELVCPGQWRQAPLCCREGSLTAGGDSEGGPAAGAGCGQSDQERWQCQWGRGGSLGGTAIQRWCRGHPGLCCQVGPFHPGQEAWGRKPEPQQSPRHYLGHLASQPRQETHTEGPGADRNLCSPFCPPGAFSLLARSGKMAWELRSVMQFTITHCTADSLVWSDKTTIQFNAC